MGPTRVIRSAFLKAATSCSTAKAARLLDFRARVPLAASVREVVGWVRGEIAAGRL